ncbi:uncharacterized protein LOC118648192, partial [Monomorium pharaonis]|uniref:uncharacterized protein LOC118648192 n=1 Tax=Monomorium pharaonis TaxID=307658 RepID=UPI0017468146
WNTNGKASTTLPQQLIGGSQIVKCLKKEPYEMNYYVPIQQNDGCDKSTLSQPRYTPRILGRRFALTATAYKYLDIGVSVGREPFVEMILGDNKSNQIQLSRDVGNNDRETHGY